jgi:hypothetical protein
MSFCGWWRTMPPTLPAREFPHLKGKGFREDHHSSFFFVHKMDRTAVSTYEYIEKLLPDHSNLLDNLELAAVSDNESDNEDWELVVLPGEEKLVTAISHVMVEVGDITMHLGTLVCVCSAKG